jgi:hypothetical protein
MDHSIAHLMEIIDGTIAVYSVKSEFPYPEKGQGLSNGQKLTTDKEQPGVSAYYRKLRDTILNYQKVVLFGPTTAKNELLDLLKFDHQFKNIKIEVKQAANMNSNERIAFVRGYFIND